MLRDREAIVSKQAGVFATASHMLTQPGHMSPPPS
jgi:hypothetical protein